jgi:hypothetical protein
VRTDELERALVTGREADALTLAHIVPVGIDDETATSMVNGFIEVLDRQPPWAVYEACLRIRRGDAKLAEGEKLETLLCRTVRELVRPYQRQLAECIEILKAEVDQAMERPPEQQAAPRPRALRDGNHMQRVMADIEARRAKKEGD